MRRSSETLAADLPVERRGPPRRRGARPRRTIASISTRFRRSDGRDGNPARQYRFQRDGREHAAHHLAEAFAGPGQDDRRKGGVPQPGRLGEGSRGTRDHRRCRGAGRAQARRDDRRRDGGEYRDRARPIGNARGYRCIICIPDDQSQEKYEILRTLGADLRIIEAVPFADPRNYYHVAREIAEQTPGAIWADQFNNTANRRAHYATTGPEIWNAFGSELTAFVAACGTGGTLAGTSMFLKERNPAIRTVLCDPMGSVLYSYIKTGELCSTGDSNTEGIGIKRITENFKGAPIDDALQVDDKAMVEMAYWLLREEGLFLGGSAALNVVGAARYARSLPKGSVVMTILCDGGDRYRSRLWNARWLAENDCTPQATDLSFL